MVRKCLKAFLQEGAILCSAHETDVGYGVNKGLRVPDRSLFHEIGPELAGQVELGIDL